jgi:hypothetical protein
MFPAAVCREESFRGRTFEQHNANCAIAIEQMLFLADDLSVHFFRTHVISIRFIFSFR